MRRLLKQFLQLESASGIILLSAAFMAISCANSAFADLYRQFTHLSLHAVNDGLMALFFLLVGLELKSGILDGHLSSRSQVLLPAIGALGGMLAPALLYLSLNYHDPIAIHGWSIPVATDIAFALGVLSFFGNRIPISLKIFLLALAIFDDMGAILIIVIFYSQKLNYLALFSAFLITFSLYLLNLLRVRSLIYYLSLGILLWICLFYSGVHPTLAGVIVGLLVPGSKNEGRAPFKRLETYLHPWVAYGIMPIFAFVNAGFSFHDITLASFSSTIVLGIVAGLFIGKQIGIFSICWFFIHKKLAKLPEAITLFELYGITILCGIGFTMSLFLGTLSLPDGNHLVEVRLGVMLASLLSGLTGAIVLSIALVYKNHRNRIID